MSAVAVATRVITRKDYLDQSGVEFRAGIKTGLAHREYYRQFVTPAVLRMVASAFTIDQLEKAFAKDRHFNTIAISRWDALSWQPVSHDSCPSCKCQNRSPGFTNGRFTSRLPIDREVEKATGETVTRSVLVSIVKQAAQMLLEQAATDNPNGA